uniref:Uncharacterized protein n=1 Tax=Anopheles christyi TaxID=43041 RepID=A0A182JU51_9DIPT
MRGQRGLSHIVVPWADLSIEKMTNSWEAARASLGSLSGSSSSGNSNITLRHEPHHSKQKQSPKYQQSPSGPASLSALIEAAAAPPPLEVSNEPYDYFDTTVNANVIAERTNSLRRLRRAGYANRSFMYHGEYPPIGMVDDGYEDDTGPGGGGGGGRLPYYVEPTYRSLEYDRRQRRRHSVHQLANFNPSSKLDDLRQRFDEYNSSAAVPRGAYYGYYTLDRHKSRQARPMMVAANPLPAPNAYGKAFAFGQSASRYSGSRSLDRVLVEEEREQRKGPKRGSRSSQGSTDSNNSTHSASSGSLLLTVANLENFAKIHRKSTAGGGGSKLEAAAGSSRTLERYLSSTLDLVPHPHPGTLGRRSRYSSNILLHHQEDDPDVHHPADHAAIDYRKDAHHHIGGSAIVPIDEISIDEGEGDGSERQLQLAGMGTGGGGPSHVSPFRSLKGKDPDSVSVASSTHFTMVNGIGGPQRVIKTGICSSGGHQITILIITMSIIFMIGICSAVFLLEMRARDMPK